MSYKCTFNNDSAYLVHFNKNHDKKGQFTFGDGDGDGTRDDHHHDIDEITGRVKTGFKDAQKRQTKRAIISGATAIGGAGIAAAGVFMSNPALLEIGIATLGAGAINTGFAFVRKSQIKNMETALESTNKQKES